MQLFYDPDLASGSQSLDEENSHHCIRVLRMKTGEQISLTNGQGLYLTARITHPDPGECRFQVIEEKRDFQALPYRLHLGIAPTKATDRFEWFLEKATETGITEISPILCERSERRHLKIERMERILESAMKQSGRAFLPRINPLIPFLDLIHSPLPASRYLAHCQAREPHLFELIQAGTDGVVLVGPEGDFSPEEIAAARTRNFREISLGHVRLRTETAGLMVCQAFNLKNLSQNGS